MNREKSFKPETGIQSKVFRYEITIFLPGVQDFIADKIYEGGMFAWPEFKRFSTVVNKASTWCAQQQDFRFCNAQALEIKVKGGKDVLPEIIFIFILKWQIRNC